MNSGIANFYDIILRSLLNAPDKVFIHWLGQSFSGTKITTQIDHFRNQLLNQHVKTGDGILIARSFSPDTLFAILAVIAHGAIPILPPAKISFSQSVRMYKKTRFKWMIIDRSPGVIATIFTKCFRIKPILFSTQNIASGNALRSSNLVPQNQRALITHSSGSTGNPKAIYRSHAVLSAQHAALKEAFPPLPDQLDFPLFPVILLHNLACGTTTLIPDIPAFNINQLDIEKVMVQLQNHAVTSMTGNVFYFKKLLQCLHNDSVTFHSVLVVGVGGSPVPEKMLHELRQCFINASIYCIYGSSEAEPIATRKVDKYSSPEKGYSVGQLAPGIRLKIDGHQKIHLAEQSYEAGEILVSGDHVVTLPGEEWYRTGDFGYLDNLGTLYLTGRKGNERSVHGLQHYQIEHTLLTMDGVEVVAAIARKDFFEIFIVTLLPLQQIQDKLKKHFPPASIGPVHFRKSLPLDSRHRSKIIYNLVK
jgi:olefin beta-lactone synthetase